MIPLRVLRPNARLLESFLHSAFKGRQKFGAVGRLGDFGRLFRSWVVPGQADHRIASLTAPGGSCHFDFVDEWETFRAAGGVAADLCQACGEVLDRGIIEGRKTLVPRDDIAARRSSLFGYRVEGALKIFDDFLGSLVDQSSLVERLQNDEKRDACQRNGDENGREASCKLTADAHI